MASGRSLQPNGPKPREAITSVRPTVMRALMVGGEQLVAEVYWSFALVCR